MDQVVSAAPRQAAKDAGLRYFTDDKPGITRRMRAGKPRYLLPDGRPVKDPEVLERIRKLAIPPAWTDVWIATAANGHLQATGRDARGRKQYRYHPQWRAARDENKFARMLAFAQALPRIRARLDADMALPGLPREKVLAAVVRLMEYTLIRIGNDEYARANESFGATTLRDEHARVRGAEVRLAFKGKSGKSHSLSVRDRRLARIMKRCQDLPGQELFQYLDEDGQVRDVGSADVNDYLREAAGAEFTAKDFRTWAASVLAVEELKHCPPAESVKGAKSNLKRAIERVAERLGNTVAICRKCYVHPLVVEAYLDGRLPEFWQSEADWSKVGEAGLATREVEAMCFLEHHLAEAAVRQ